MPPKFEVYSYRSNAPGPHLLVLGAIHGDEICGTIAASRLRTELDLDILQLQAGELTLVPVCNPVAYKARKRFVSSNLNRIIARHADPEDHEHEFANALTALIERADIVLDLHAYPAGKTPFLFLDYQTDANRDLAAAQGITHWLTGWPELYAKMGESLSQGDTVSYANAHGKTGIVVECGHYTEPAAITVAYTCIRRSLAYLGLMQNDHVAQLATPQICQVREVVLRDRSGSFAKPWQHLDAVATGEPLIRYDDGTVLTAPFDGFVLLPNEKVALNQEWLYLGS